MYKPHTRKPARTSTLARWALAGSLFLSLLLFSGPAAFAMPTQPAAGGFEVVSLPPEAMEAPILPPESEAGSVKMEEALAEVASAAGASAGKAMAVAESEQLRLDGERVQILITTTADRADAATDAVVEAGGEVTGRANGDTWLQAWVPMSALEQVSSSVNIDYLSRPEEVSTMATTQGAAIINSPAWNAAGYTGAGVKVAVIDGGFQGYSSLLGTELPSSVTVKNFVDGETDAQANGTTVHGTACAEIVHDIAPNAAILLVKVNTTVDLEEAVNWAKAQGAKIITTSLGWYNQTPGDGTGFFANLVQSARNSGIFWTTAASNDREAHWGGAFSDGNGNGYHQFSGSQEVDYFGPGDGNAWNIPSGYAIRVFLRWDDWSAKNQDYDLYIFKWNGSAWQVVASSQNRQTGGSGQSPTEYVGITSSGTSAPYGFAIKRYNANRNVNLEVFAPKVDRLDELVHERSLANLADAPAAMTVAALDVNSPFPQESYSSEGPTNGPGGTASGGAIKPDISGFANVATISYPNNSFNGTSSATPHVAGAAAVVLSAYPAWTPAQIQSFLTGRAVDMGSPGKDTVYGWGRLNLGDLPPAEKRVNNLLLRVVPKAPVLNAISNAAGLGTYTVSWGAVSGAKTYVLQETKTGSFGSATTVYSGPNASWPAAGKSAGTYTYRVKAVDAKGGSSVWSNTRSTTVK